MTEALSEQTPIHPPQIQYATPKQMALPLRAAEDRAMEATTPTEIESETSEPFPELPTTPEMDIQQLANEVYEIIVSRLQDEKERRGYF